MKKEDEITVGILLMLVLLIIVAFWGDKIKDSVAILENLALVFALPIGWYEYRNAKSATEAERREASQTDEKWVEYLTLCFDNPDLDIWDMDSRDMPPDRRKELIAFEMLISKFERAFLTYHDLPIESEIRQRYWTGWDAYIKSFSKGKNFSDAWAIFGSSFDPNFQDYMNCKAV